MSEATSGSVKGRVRRIIVGVDGSPSSVTALRWAIAEAEHTGDTVEAVIAWQVPISAGGYGWAPVLMDNGANLEAVAEKTLAQTIDDVVPPESSVNVEQRVVEGNPNTVLIGESARADLLVVGSRGHGTFASALLGSVSQNCAHHAKCPVVIVRG
jgi:nucleotide-binding universal stress UspA family protein